MNRQKLSLVVILGLLASSSVGALQQRSQPDKTFEEKDDAPVGRTALSVNVEQVQVDVTVQDRKGNLISGLTQDHFKVYEDKLEQEITFFAPIEAPMTVVLLVEYSAASNWEILWEAIQGSYAFVSEMRPEDWLAVVAYDIRPEILVDFTQDKAEAFNALRRLNYPAFRESSLYDSVYDTLDRISEAEGKVSIVLVTTGLNTISKKNLKQVLRKVQQSDVIMYPVVLGGNFRARNDHRISSTTRLDLLQGDAVMKEFAKLTGGQAFFPRFAQSFPGIFQTISLLLRNQYSLGYVSANRAKDEKFRSIRVEVSADVDGNGKPDKLKVAHRKGYVANQQDTF